MPERAPWWERSTQCPSCGYKWCLEHDPDCRSCGKIKDGTWKPSPPPDFPIPVEPPYSIDGMIGILGPDLRQRCREWAKDTVAWLAKNKQAYKDTVNDIHQNVSMLAKSKGAEVIAALIAGQDIEAVYWGIGPQRGNRGDVAFMGRDAEVRYTELDHYIIWPFNKRHNAAKYDFDIIVQVVPIRGTTGGFMLNKWIPRDEFLAKKQIAKNTRGLIDGSWYILAAEAYDMDLL
jgi:hypothetical protein